MADVRGVDETLASISGHGSMRLNAKHLDENIKGALTGATIVRTIVGAPTLEWDINDPQRVILKSGILGNRVSMSCGPFHYELVSASKSGPSLTITGEDRVVATLRRQVKPLKVRKGLMTHVEFARKLVNEVPWLKFHTDPNASVVKSKEDLIRGRPAGGTPQDSWNVLTTNAQNRGWRCFIRGVDQVWYVPDSYLFEQDTAFKITEGKGGIDSIDGEYDKGQRLATLTIICRASRWLIPPGVIASVFDMGMYDGKWIVQDITRSPFGTNTTVTIIKPQPTLPEPSSQSSSGGGGSTGGDFSSAARDVQVAHAAYVAGWRGNDLVTSVAVAHAESGFKANAEGPRNSNGTFDYGTWQVNSSHGFSKTRLLSDEQYNANSAFKIFKEQGWHAWSTYNSGAYRQWMSQAAASVKQMQADLASGKGQGTGVAPPRSNSKLSADFLDEALSQRGKPYIFGSQTSPKNNNPRSFDCSLLVQWAAGRVGISLPRTADTQYEACVRAGTTISVAHALHTPGALLFEAGSDGTTSNPGHVAISMGNGTETMEALGHAYGTNEFADGKNFTHAGLVPGMRY